VKIDGPLYSDLADVGQEAVGRQEAGFDGVYSLEGSRDPFFPLLLASQAAPALDISTGIAVAFPRNPYHVACQAWDLQRFSGGRFSLGLGSQVRAHIERRFGVAFDRPAARMREYIMAVRAFFDCWQDGKALKFEGEFFRHTLMTPMFNPGPLDCGPPRIVLGALGPPMTAVAGQVADGLLVHPFNTVPFLRDVQLPAVNKSLAKAGRRREDFVFNVTAMCITGANEEQMRAAYEGVRSLLGFYGSTPAYRRPMEAVGYGELQPELNKLTRENRWDELPQLVDDSLVEHFAVIGEPQQLGARLAERYAGLADSLGIYAPYAAEPGLWREVTAGTRRAFTEHEGNNA